MQTDVRKFENLQYLIRYPENFTPGQRYPVILNIHGAGSRGTDISVIAEGAAFRLTESLTDFPFVMVAPQCPADTWFDLFEQLQRFTRFIAEAAFTDPDRLYLMGTSMGAFTVWQLAMSLPELFAAMVPICGGGMEWNAARLKNIPVWAFHGLLDTTVPAERSISMVRAVNNKGGSARITVYPERKHDAWTDTYSNPQVFAWLLSHTRQTEKVTSDDYGDSKKYG